MTISWLWIIESTDLTIVSIFKSDKKREVFPKMPIYSTNVWWKFKLNVIQITLDLPKQAATPKFGIQVVLTTEPKPVTVCATEPSCGMKIKWDRFIFK